MKSLFTYFHNLKHGSRVLALAIVTIFSSCSSDSEVFEDFSGQGKGGSMARFTFLKGYLYVVDEGSLKTIDISQADNPKVLSEISLDVTVETIYPYENYLFLGTVFGMYIYSLENGPVPQFLSVFEHAYACDPVIVVNNTAYVTLRSNTDCATGPDRMEVVDVTNLSYPRLLKTIDMMNPHGLAASDTLLFVGEGSNGLKVFNIKDRANPIEFDYFEDIPTYDIITNYSRKELIITGENGVYQYNYQKPDSIYQLSHIPRN